MRAVMLFKSIAVGDWCDSPDPWAGISSPNLGHVLNLG